MKRFLVVVFIFAGIFMSGCPENPVNERYFLQFPDLPPAWEDMLGNPCWLTEWINADGLKESKIIKNGNPEISLFRTSANAVSAMPYWPEKGLSPGVFRPAGAIFPFDVSGRTCVLSWQGGVDAVLYRELAIAFEGQDSVKVSIPRLPRNFNWPRFRQLFDDPSLNAAVRGDPWLADWPGIAEKIIQSGFDKRRLVPETRGSLAVPAGPGPWIGTSPFAAPLLFEEVPSFPVRKATDTWVSPEGILRCNAETWILVK